jgi:hypothetical protein
MGDDFNFPIVNFFHLHVDTLQQHLYMEYIFLSWYGIPTCIWSISFSVDTVFQPVYGVYLSQLIRYYNMYMEYIFLSWYGIPTCIWSISFSIDTVFQSVYGIYLSQLIRYSNLYMEYIFLSWYGIPVVVVPIMIFLIEVFFYNEATKTRVHNC